MSESKHIRSLTGVRGLAALWVALFHSLTYFPATAYLPAVLKRFLTMGWIAVDMFFVLSGFVIAYVHQSDFQRLTRSEYARFLRLRLARIYPAHFVATLVLVPLVVGAAVFSLYAFDEQAWQQYTVRKLVLSLLLINDWGIPDSQGWNVPSWSVGSEWFAYLCFPLLAVVLNRATSVRTFVTTIVITLAVMVGLAATINQGKQYMLPYAWTLTRVISAFLIGACIYNIHKRGSWLGAWYDPAAGLVLAAIAFAACAGLHPFYDFLYILLFAMLVLALARATGRVAAVMGSRVAVYLGKISYSIYLTHATVLIVVNQGLKVLVGDRFGLVAQSTAFVLTYAVGVVLAGHVLYVLVEEPARDFLRRRWVDGAQGWRAAVPAAANPELPAGK